MRCIMWLHAKNDPLRNIRKNLSRITRSKRSFTRRLGINWEKQTQLQQRRFTGWRRKRASVAWSTCSNQAEPHIQKNNTCRYAIDNHSLYHLRPHRFELLLLLRVLRAVHVNRKLLLGRFGDLQDLACFKANGDVFFAECVVFRGEFNEDVKWDWYVGKCFEVEVEEVGRDAADYCLMAYDQDWVFLALDPVDQGLQSTDGVDVRLAWWIAEG